MTQMRYLRRWAWSALICGLPLCLITAPNGFGQETRAKIRVAIPSPSICCLHLFAAQQWKIFEKTAWMSRSSRCGRRWPTPP